MKRLFIIAIVLSCMQAFAQDQFNTPYLGLKLGWNYSQLTFSNPTLENVDVNFKSGFAGGVYCNIPVHEKFAIQPEILYSQMGAELDEVVGQVTETTTLNLNYFSFPILIRFNPLPKLGVFVGPQFDLLYDTHSSLNGDEEDLQTQVTSYDVGGTAGLEYWFKPYFGIYGRYIFGFQDVNERNPGIDLSAQTITSEIANNGLQLGITLALRGKADKEEEVKPAPVVVPAADSDKDGIGDDVDKCPTQAGTAKYNGCPIPDTDGDGVNDEADRCPKTAGIAGNMGCPEMILYYSREDAALDSNDMSNLDIVVNFMNRHPDLSVIVEGHTSTPGDDAYNMTLSQKRANDAVDYIVSKGVDRKRMIPKGMGEQNPVGDNSTDEGRAKSRRVVIKIAQ